MHLENFEQIFLIMKCIRFAVAAAAFFTLPTAVTGADKGAEVRIADNLLGRVLTVNGNNHTVEVYADPSSKPTGALEIPYCKIDLDDVYVVTGIAPEGFAHCAITSVKVPNSMEYVGRAAFNGCTKLASFTETEPGTVETVGEDAFRFTSAMKSISLPGVVSVGDFAFTRSGVETVSLPAISRIGAGAFQECGSLANVNVGPELTYIGSIAFCNCPALTGITLTEALTEIGATAFGYCTALKEVVIPRNLRACGRDAFRGCGLTTVYILSENFMDYADMCCVLRNKSITGLYAIDSMVGEIAYYLSTGSANNPAETLTDAPVAPMSDVMCVEFTAGSTRSFRLVEVADGITDVKVYGNNGTEIIPSDGVYTLTDKEALLSYSINGINRLSYYVDLDAMSMLDSTLRDAEMSVTSRDGYIYVEAGEPADVAVYGIDGRMVASCRIAGENVSAQVNKAPLSNGVYAVSVNGKARKIAVR